MSGKTARQIRKEFNRIEKKVMAHKKEVANQLVRELLNALFKYRFLFAIKILFPRRKK